MSDPLSSDPDIRSGRAPAARSVRSRPEKSERERRVIEGLKGGVAMAEIARREGITERGLRKYVRTLFARRAPEATGAFIATQMNRLNEALLVSFGAMSADNLPAVDRVVKIVRELDRYQGLSGGAAGTESRRKLLESLNSGAETEPCAALERGEAEALAEDESSDSDLQDPLADLIPDPTAFAGRLSQGVRPQAGVATPPSSRAERGDPEAAGPNDSGLNLGPAAPGWLRVGRHDGFERADLGETRGTEVVGNPLESLEFGSRSRAFPARPGGGSPAGR